MTRFVIAFGMAAALVGCAAEQEKTEPEPLPASLENNVLDAVPADIETRTFIDFEGKVQIVGYSLEPKGVIKPGDTVKLTTYWTLSSKLGPSWKLFTHLVDASGKRLTGGGNIDNVGPLRQGDGEDQALPPSKWQVGKVYVDSQEFQMPRDVKSPYVSITVGVWKNQYRLDVISGPHDAERRAIIATVPTGIVVPKPVRQAKRPDDAAKSPQGE
jgi:hypothetical protein